MERNWVDLNALLPDVIYKDQSLETRMEIKRLWSLADCKVNRHYEYIFVVLVAAMLLK